ncbi:MAG: carbon monoxide dehydrogenase subunit G [Aestuariivirga sp.]|jgi:carbon monoxide dehydrogenase subunit G|nr:carbon monoxide dehydrogenase subunit G [Hyphomicrobiales bacterium]MBP9173030.1 carbon monoxide dehydrogenase subunit G [Hyphomicrobiales bacterium]
MKMSGSQVIDAPRDAVWKGLNDPKVLQQCIPGCESIVASSPTQMSAKVVLKIGPVKAAFKGSVTLSDIKAPESYRISGKGEGGFAGFASGGATVKLTATSPSETLMEYDVDAQVGGKIAMLGSRLVDSTAQSLANQFFERFAAVVKQSAAAVPKKPKAKAAKKPAKKPAAKKPVKAKKVAAKAKKKPAKKKR